MKVAPNCSKVKGQINPQPSVSSLAAPSLKSMRQNSFTESVRSIPTATPTAIPVAKSIISTPTARSIISTPRPVSVPGAELRALYSYEAQNTDELSIVEGDLLHIIDHDDGTGWIKAQKGIQVGLVPANYIEYLDAPAEDDTVYDNDAPVINEPSIHDLPPSPATSPAPTQVVALYDFEAVNAEELNIRQGDTITVTKKDDGGWWEGTLNGQTGIFPANYVSSQ